MDDIEAVRMRYRPKVITTLFIGESAPKNGTFFYCGENSLLNQVRLTMKLQSEDAPTFLEHFKNLGWYLDDLVLTPINKMRPSERRAKWVESENGLAQRIALYEPQAIVTLLLSIKAVVERAAHLAGSTAPRHYVPFPGNGQQARFRKAMSGIIGKLPRATSS